MAQRLRIKVTPPIRDVAGVIITPGELKIQEIDGTGGVVALWPQSLVDSIVDMRIAVRPTGDSRVRVLFEAGLEGLLMDSPKLDNI